MKAIAAWLLIVITCMVCSFIGADAATLRTFNFHDVAGKAKGVGSVPSVILRDGTICATDKAHPLQSVAFGTIPAAIVKIISLVI
jgi:hypothetical protein